MSHLKDETVTMCISLLREFINQTPGMENTKGVAVLALNQLHRITGGTDTGDPIDGSEPPLFTEIICEGHPRADGAPSPDFP